MKAPRIAAFAITLSAVTSVAVPVHGKWFWEPPIQTTHAEVFNPAEPHKAGALGGYLALGRGTAPWHLHRVYSAWLEPNIWVNSLDQYEQVGADLDWAQAWLDREDLAMGQISGTDVTFATDVTLLVDAWDRVHTTHEMWRQV